MWISNLVNIMCRRDYPFLTVYTWHSCWKLVEHICMDLFLGSLFHWSIWEYHAVFNYWNLVLYFEIQEVWCLQLCSSSSRLIWLFWILTDSIWILKLFYIYICKKMSFRFDRIGIKSVHCFAKHEHFNNTKSSKSCSQDIFLFVSF